MVIIFNFILHIAIITGLLGLIYISFKLAWFYKMPSDFERGIRIMACVVGFLLYIGSRAVGLSIPELMISAITQGGYINIFIVTVLLPAGLGVVVTSFIINRLQDSHTIALRIVLMLAVFIIFLLFDSYTLSFGHEIDDNSINKFLLPNMIFTLSACLYAIFFLKPEHLP